MFFTLLDASFTAFLVASSQLLLELESTSITFNTAILFGFGLKISEPPNYNY
jgi:hypothetical protein